MSEKSRRWFQVHLSTAVVLMFVAGGLMWANMRTGLVESKVSPAKIEVYGWPLAAYRQYDIVNAKLRGILPNDFNPERDSIGLLELHWWNFNNLAINVAIAFIILAITAFSSEWRIRRREARKP